MILARDARTATRTSLARTNMVDVVIRGVGH